MIRISGGGARHRRLLRGAKVLYAAITVLGSRT